MSNLSLNDKFQQFLRLNGISEEEYDHAPLPRYFCPSSKSKLSHSELASIGTVVPYFPSFYCFHKGLKPSQLVEYQTGLIYSLDIASGIAVDCLDVKSGMEVLDLCAAPGAKLCLLFEKLGLEGTVTGVDISRKRLCITRRMMSKYRVSRVRLFDQDGTAFNIGPPSRIGKELICECGSCCVDKVLCGSDRDLGYKAPFYSSRLLRGDTQKSQRLYDRVLVDAECTHDGSILHIEKMKNNNWLGVEKFLDNERLEGLQGLQRGLIENGFRLLRVGGILVYSTCSFATGQNEEIVRWLLEKYSNAKLDQINGVFPCTMKSLMLRFTPRISNTSGLFIAKIIKIS